MNNPVDDDLDSSRLEERSSVLDLDVAYVADVSRYERALELWREHLDRSETETEGGN